MGQWIAVSFPITLSYWSPGLSQWLQRDFNWLAGMIFFSSLWITCSHWCVESAPLVSLYALVRWAVYIYAQIVHKWGKCVGIIANWLNKIKSELYLFHTHILYTHVQTHNCGNLSNLTPAFPLTRSLSPYLSTVVWTVGESLSNIVSGFSPFLPSSFFCVSLSLKDSLSLCHEGLFLPALISEGAEERERRAFQQTEQWHFIEILGLCTFHTLAQ